MGALGSLLGAPGMCVFRCFRRLERKTISMKKVQTSKQNVAFSKVLRCVPQHFRQILVSVSQLWAVGRLVADFGLPLSSFGSLNGAAAPDRSRPLPPAPTDDTPQIQPCPLHACQPARQITSQPRSPAKPPTDFAKKSDRTLGPFDSKQKLTVTTNNGLSEIS